MVLLCPHGKLLSGRGLAATLLGRARHDRGPAAPDSSMQQPSSLSLYSQYTRALGASPGTTAACPNAAKTSPQVLPTKLELSVQFCLNLQH